MSHLLQDCLSAQAERRSDALAVVMSGARVTYGELEVASNQLANLLREAGCRHGDRVCLLLPKSPAAIVAILGVLKAGGIYVPLDTASPVHRLARIVGAVENRWFLGAGPVTALLDELMGARGSAGAHSLGWLSSDPCETSVAPEFTWLDVMRHSSAPSAAEAVPEDPAHILFTSGSTGAPKGVVVKHESVLSFIRWAVEYFGTEPTDRISCHPPLHFDLSTFDIFGTFLAGAELYLVPTEASVVPQALADWMRKSELTQWFSVPSALSYLAQFDVVKKGDFPSLRRLLWCGEVIPTPTLIYWMTRLPHARFTNLYGPTEATIASSYYTVPAVPDDDRAPIPIGRPCAGEELLILDESLRPVPEGEAGDLYIRGVGLSPGYWRDPDKTAQAFRPNPLGDDPTDRVYRTGDLARSGPDGLIYFLGRVDTQIKSRGYRIELGEIEAGLGALGMLAEYAVVAVDDSSFGGPVICCAYVWEEDRGAGPAEIRMALKKLLPSYMLPVRWRALPQLPKNVNGKIDRARLKAMFTVDSTRSAC